jgi:hypothetical protein
MGDGAALRGDRAQIITFQDIEHLDQMHAAGGGRRHRHDLITAIAAAQRRAQHRAVVLQVIERHHATGGAQGGDELLRRGAFVKGARAFACDRFQGGGEIGLHQAVAGTKQCAIGFEENLH